MTYAIDGDGAFVYVDNVLTGKRCGCFCPACKEPLIAKNKGTKRIHHFAHLSGIECEHAYESMLHMLAKEKIREVFLSKSEFYIEFEHKSFCNKYGECKFYVHGECYKSERRAFNIKQYYDSCAQEISYDNINRRSDLKIFSSVHPEREPIYLEFCVTHASDTEKIHSGKKIIEIHIESEDDILRIVENGIIESEYNCGISNDLENYLQKVVFYGFEKEDFNNDNIDTEIEFVRYILDECGEMQRVIDESCNCRYLAKAKEESLLEICVHDFRPSGNYKKILYFGFKEFQIPNCKLCENYVDSYSIDYNRWNRRGDFCGLYKQLQVPRDIKFDTTRARICSNFKINIEEMVKLLEHGLGCACTIFKKI